MVYRCEKARPRIYPMSALGLHTCLTFIRHQFRPPSLCSRHVTEYHTTSVAHASASSGIGCSSPSVAASLRLLAPSLHAPLHSVTPPGSLQASVAAVTHTPVTFCNTLRRLSLFFGRISHQASPSRHTPEPCAPGTQKPREKLLTFQRHSVDFPTTKHQPLCSAITINTS